MSGAEYYLMGMVLTMGAIWFAPGIDRIRRRRRGHS